MNRMAKVSVVAVACAASLALASCGSSNPGSTGSGAAAPTTGGAATSSGEQVTMELWHNGTGEKGPAFFEKAVSDFEAAHSNVKINITIVQNEDFDGKLQTAMAGGTTPDIFLQRGGGKLNDQVKADQVMDITSLIDPQVKSEIGGNWALETLDSKIYAVPMSLQPEGFWYSGNLFKDAGVDAKSITDMTSLSAAVDKLKASSKSAISLGGKDAWPAAHWFYQFALRQCSKDVIQGLVGAQNFDDPCWLAALQSLADFAKTEPFNSGFLTTAAQQGAGSSAGMVANYQAAMELMGAWEVGVIGGLTPDKKNLPDLGFFPFPKVDGGKGDQAAMMAGADAYSCSIKAPKECADFLNFLGAKAQQEGFSEAFSQIPANSTASGKVTDPALKAAADALAKSPYTVLWIDSALGQDTGNAVNAAVVALLAGSADPAAALAQMQKAF